MKFSFIIPTKNEEKYLGKCLESIKKQRNKNYEIIVVDGYSSDKTAKIASKYGARIIFEKRSGPAAARNTGAKISSGDILVFVDADVRFSSDFSDKIKARFQGSLGGAIFRIGVYDAKSRYVTLAYELGNSLVTFLNKLGIAMTFGSCFVFEKQIFNAVGGFDSRLLTCEDHDLARRIAKKSRVKYCPEITVYTSTRRTARYGLVKLMIMYAESTLLYFFKHKSLTNYWQ